MWPPWVTSSLSVSARWYVCGLADVQNQQAREHFGQTDDLTELPEEYKQLEQRVDALRSAHQAMMQYVLPAYVQHN